MMENEPDAEAKVHKTELAGRELPTPLEFNSNENANMLTALKLALEDISPTPHVDANVNPLPASTFL